MAKKFDVSNIDNFDIRNFTAKVSNNGLAHADRHEHRTDVQVLDEVMRFAYHQGKIKGPNKQGKIIDGTFDNNVIADEIKEQVIKYNKKRIENWYNKNPLDEDTRFAIAAPVDDCSSHGFKFIKQTGFVNSFQHSSSCIVVLCRDKTAPSGMRIQTAYAGIQKEHTERPDLPTHLDVIHRNNIVDLLKQTRTYQECTDPMYKAFMVVQCSPDKYSNKSAVCDYDKKNERVIVTVDAKPFVKDGISHDTQWVMQMDKGHCNLFRECKDNHIKIGAAWMRDLKNNHTKEHKKATKDASIDLESIDMNSDEALELLNTNWFVRSAMQMNAIKNQILDESRQPVTLDLSLLQQNNLAESAAAGPEM